MLCYPNFTHKNAKSKAIFEKTQCRKTSPKTVHNAKENEHQNARKQRLKYIKLKALDLAVAMWYNSVCF